MFKGVNICYEMDDRNKGIASGGIGVIHLMAKRLGLGKEIDKHLHLLKRHLPYHESDHVLNLAYNVLVGGTRLEDIELQRQDEGWMDALGVEVIPDPTTAGDFLRRFSEPDVVGLMEVIHERRKRVWDRQGKGFFKKAILNMDGTMTETMGSVSKGWIFRIRGFGGMPHC
jgi:hypothetical protein